MNFNFPGLLFYHSCTAPEADFAMGRATPTFYDAVSVIEDGAQGVGEGIFGKSITDPCLGWDKTEKLILDIADKL